MKKVFYFLIFLTQTSIAQKSIQFDSLFEGLYKKQNFNGNILIAEKGKIIYQKSFGMANEATKEKLNENSIFELASVSKQFTAMAIAILKEKNKLKFDDKIEKYIPELSFYKNVTIRNLLNHTGGLPDYMDLMDSSLTASKIINNNDVIEFLKINKPKSSFEPNTEFEYSNTGYTLLASIVERVSKITFAEFLKQNIFNPLGMKNTEVISKLLHPKELKNFAAGYVQDSLKVNILPETLESNKYVINYDGVVGAGRIKSTAKDLLLWDKSLYSNKIINQETLKEIYTPGKLNNSSVTKYGFGWGIDNKYSVGKIVNHIGGWAGYATFIERDIDKQNTIIILQNFRNDNTELPIREVRSILYNIKPLILDSTYLKSLTGEFKTSKGRIRKILFEQEKLYVLNGTDRTELVPQSKTKFDIAGSSPEAEIEFVIEKGIVVKYLVLNTYKGLTSEVLKVR
jgi:CubicO group peptidase (beta-lactamase class C family)